MIKFKFIYPLSIFLSYLIITNGGGEINFGIGIGILIFALWLCAPLGVAKDDGDSPLMFWVSYIMWVGIQWAIYYYGLGPPRGVGIPGFY